MVCNAFCVAVRRIVCVSDNTPIAGTFATATATDTGNQKSERESRKDELFCELHFWNYRIQIQ